MCSFPKPLANMNSTTISYTTIKIIEPILFETKKTKAYLYNLLFVQTTIKLKQKQKNLIRLIKKQFYLIF